MPDTSLPLALAELDVLRREGEAAVGAAVTAAEAILAACRDDDPACLEIARAQAVAVIEACGYADIASQRLSKIAELLQAATAATAGRRGADGAGREETEEERRRRELMLNGPALDGPETRQATIDAMFEGK